MTLNSRLDTAAAAIVTRMIIRRRPRMFLPELPFRRTSTGASAIMARGEKKKDKTTEQRKQKYQKKGPG